MAVKRKRKQTLNQFIISKLLDDPKGLWKDKVGVSREMGFTKKLINKYPLKAFWVALPPKFNAESLAWYISPQGWAYLEIEYAKFSLDLAPPIRHNIPNAKFSKTIRRIITILKKLRSTQFPAEACCWISKCPEEFVPLLFGPREWLKEGKLHVH